jgi:hypothetical protein
MGTILAIPDDGERLVLGTFGDLLLGIYRSYRKGLECVYAEWGKECLQLAGQPD